MTNAPKSFGGISTECDLLEKKSAVNHDTTMYWLPRHSHPRVPDVKPASAPSTDAVTRISMLSSVLPSIPVCFAISKFHIDILVIEKVVGYQIIYHMGLKHNDVS